jgi:hypothetical protein
MRVTRGVVLGILCVGLTAAVWGAGETAEPPPLPFHGVEGYGGCFSTYCAHLVNSPPVGQKIGLPSFGGIFVRHGHGRYLTSLTATETLTGRLELGYGFNRFETGDLPDDVAVKYEL